MKVFPNALPVNTCKKICDFALEQLLTVSEKKRPVVMWTNYGWPENIVKDSATVFCFLTPDEFLSEIESCLKDLQIFDASNDCALANDEGQRSICLIYVWTNNSYIPVHSDGKHRKTATIYCNATWSFDKGGVFQWLDSGTGSWKTLVPSCGTVIFNDKDETHATTPVKSKEFRVSLQIFLLQKGSS